MKNLLSTLLFLCLFTKLLAQDTTKVLFIGNSYTSQNDLPNLFKLLAQGAGKNVVVDSYMPGGVSVGDTAQGTMAHMNNPAVFAIINSNKWDYVMLQDNQGRFCLGYKHFPASSYVIAGHIKIRDSVLHNNHCAHMLWYAGYGPKAGAPPYGNTGEALIDSIYHNYQYLRDTAGQILAPIGPAFLRIMNGYPSIDLWYTDAVHPSLYGSYLIACVVYSTIFKSSPIVSTYNPGITASEDSLMKNTGYTTTMDSLYKTGLSDITPTVVRTGNTLKVTGYPTVVWYCNGAVHPSTNGVTNINPAGKYYAVVTNGMGCTMRTLETNYTITGIDGVAEEEEILFPNPANEEVFIKAKSFENLTVINALGAVVFKTENPLQEINISLKDWQEGVYFFALKGKENTRMIKLLVRH
jgi:hypothetical protein